MSNIGQRVFVLGGNQLYMTLGNEEFIRPMSIGNTWTKLKIGVLLAYTGDSTNNLTLASFMMGVCSGTTNGFRAATTTNFVGALMIGAGADPANGSTLTYTANTGNPVFSAAFPSHVTRVATTTAFNNPGSNTGFTPVAGTGTLVRRAAFYLTILKGSPNYTLQAFQSIQTSVDQPFYAFLDGMEQVGTPAINAVTYAAATAGTIAASETPGSLNAVNLAYNKTSFPAEIYAIAAYRMQ